MAFDVNSERAKLAQAEWFVSNALGLPAAELARLRSEQARMDRLVSTLVGPIAGALSGQVPFAGQPAIPQPLVSPPAMHLAEPPQPAAGTTPAKRPPAAHWFKDARAHPLTYWLRRLAVQRGCSELAAAEVWCDTLRLSANLNRLVVCHDGQAQRITGDLAADQPRKEDGKLIEPKPDPELAERARAHVGLAIGRAFDEALTAGSLQAFEELAWLGCTLALTAADAEALFPELHEPAIDDAGAHLHSPVSATDKKPKPGWKPGQLKDLPSEYELWDEFLIAEKAHKSRTASVLGKRHGVNSATIRRRLKRKLELRKSPWRQLAA
jgi:hypothetical protein